MKTTFIIQRKDDAGSVVDTAEVTVNATGTELIDELYGDTAGAQITNLLGAIGDRAVVEKARSIKVAKDDEAREAISSIPSLAQNLE